MGQRDCLQRHPSVTGLRTQDASSWAFGEMLTALFATVLPMTCAVTFVHRIGINYKHAVCC
jgi:hypothetical protein